MFYTFHQNNVRGLWQQSSHITRFMVVEADSAKEAWDILMDIPGLEQRYCECCGDSWYRQDDQDGTDVPMVYGRVIVADSVFPKNYTKFLDGPEGRIHYKDGKVESFW